jgi:hypothetical protein
MTSQPYQVFVRLLSVLHTIIDTVPERSIRPLLTLETEEIALRWLTEEIPTPACRQLLHTPHLLRVAECILRLSQQA